MLRTPTIPLLSKLLALSLVFVACDDTEGEDGAAETTDGEAEGDEDDSEQEGVSAVAVLKASKKIANPAPEIEGSGTLTAEDGEVTLELSVENCPEGDHGFHIHAGTKCGKDGSDAKAHWDPAKVGEDDPEHAGNVGKVRCDEDGKGKLSFSHELWDLEAGSEFNPEGLTVVLHGLDKKQRIACGSIDADDDGLVFELSAMELEANPAEGIKIEVSFEQNGDELEITAEASDCPEGSHGFHIHTGKKCGDDGKDAGPHWDPTELGLDDPLHLGNLPAIECDDEGKGSLSLKSEEINLSEGDDLNPIGLTMVVHGIDPANRVACGVIEAGE